MYLFTAGEMRRLDEAAINTLGIPGVILMENAGLQVVEEIYGLIGNPKGKNVAVFIGKGNNGGDGLVVARHLLNAGAEVKVLMFADASDITGDAKINLDILQAMGHKVFAIVNANSLNIVKLALVYTDLVVDAVFGTGFKGAVSGHVGKVFDIINDTGKPVVAIDIPSGLEADTGKVNGPCIKATSTVTFAQAKLGLIVEKGPLYTGKITVADISIPPELVRTQGIKRFLTTEQMLKEVIPKRNANSHKGSYGKVLVIGGARGLSGAAALSAMAALKAGAGLVTLAVPEGLHDLIEVKLTEVMTEPLSETEEGTISLKALSEIEKILQRCDVIALGPGISTNESTVSLIQELLPSLQKPTVIDADGLNALIGCPELLRECKASMVLTPHPGEMARLLGIKTEEVQNNRIEIASQAAGEWGCVIVLKGACTVIAGPEGSIYINPTGNPGMATGGSGDVLTGIIAGLLGQGLSPLEAAYAGAYLHGLAGDLAIAEKGQMSLVAGDLLNYLPMATKEY